MLEQWEQIKAREQKHAGQTRSVLRGMPKALPSLLRAHEIGTRVAAVGFDWAKTADVVDKIEEEVAELRRAVDSEGRGRVEEEMGDLLFAIANLAQQARHRAGVGAAEGERTNSAQRFQQLERASRGARALGARCDARGDGRGVAAGEGRRMNGSTATITDLSTMITMSTMITIDF